MCRTTRDVDGRIEFFVRPQVILFASDVSGREQPVRRNLPLTLRLHMISWSFFVIVENREVIPIGKENTGIRVDGFQRKWIPPDNQATNYPNAWPAYHDRAVAPRRTDEGGVEFPFGMS